MKTNSFARLFAMPLLCVLAFAGTAAAQFTFGGQLVQRAEYRNGYGQLIPQGTDPAVFISQRFRLQGTYQFDKVTLFASIQDVRTWGSAPQTNITDGLLSMHEAWAEIRFDSNWTAKLGRQELNYDNARFLGNLDWALQARSHDFGLVKYERNKMKLHFGGGFNQDAEALTGNIFNVANQYKTAQMLRCENKFGNLELALLFWNNGKQYVSRDTDNVIVSKGIRYSQTFGISTVKYTLKNTSISGFGYFQVGKDVKNRTLNAFDASLQVSHLLHATENKTNQLRITLGAEIISGTANNYTGNQNFSFSPMYGTNHAHNGYMDMFYVGGRYEGLTGLNDLFLLAKYEFSPAFFISVNGHSFSTYAGYYVDGVEQDKMLGTEVDATIGYVLNKAVSFQAGYSQMFATGTLEKIQNVSNPQGTQNWAYLSVIVRPGSDKKFMGLMF